ncbi:MAG TPA: hypothetical protein VFE62_16115 [Gemmataceae bacterium]|nr:hypothetical protein [Gemmataceae bacterium]
MQQLPLQQLPNQSFSVLLDGNQWTFLFKTIEDTTVASLTLNGTDLLDSARCAAGSFLIPSEYEEEGNFFFVTQNQQLPYYTEFNVTQSLIYVSANELAALRAPKSLPITAADFNPLASLPLRFTPQGYTQA